MAILFIFDIGLFYSQIHVYKYLLNYSTTIWGGYEIAHHFHAIFHPPRVKNKPTTVLEVL